MLLIHWDRIEMDNISQTTFPNVFSSMKNFEFRLRFHWSLFLWVKLTIFKPWLRQWLGAVQAISHYLNQFCLVYWRIYASRSLNELIPAVSWDIITARCYWSFREIDILLTSSNDRGIIIWTKLPNDCRFNIWIKSPPNKPRQGNVHICWEMFYKNFKTSTDMLPLAHRRNAYPSTVIDQP